MRKISLILVIFVLTAPALARVDIICEPNVTDLNSVTVRYVVTGETYRVRAIALDISLSDDVNIVEVNDFHVGESSQWTTKAYGIFPASFAANIDPDPPVDWDDAGYTPLGEENDYPDDTLEGLDSNGITVELGSLYVEEVNAPELTGVLLEFTAENPDNTVVTIALNQIRGGIVLEDPDEEVGDVNLVGCVIRQHCLIGGNAGALEHSYWVTWGKPNCWCYQRQCRGDINGLKTMNKWVQSADLNLFRNAYGKTNAQLALITGGICADLNHKPTMGKHVQSADLTIFRKYYGDATAAIPTCDLADPPNGYSVPYTGPYNFWTSP